MRLSVIVPVHNGGKDFQDCLAALRKSTRQPDELIVVDDASTDVSAQVASEFGAHVITQGKTPVGPAASRNRGAGIAHGDILVFIDADVLVHDDTLAAFEDYFLQNPEITAMFGSYDDHPPHRNPVSLYKNLQHHFVHQHGKQEASTFWAGAGAIRREIFARLGGFNESYSEPSIEDIELGLRLRNSGYRVWLCPDVLVTHLKRWNFFSWLRTDIFSRAVPWTRLILSSSQMPSDLNLDPKSRVSALLVWGMLVNIGLGFWLSMAWLVSILLLALFITLNFQLYYFFHQRGGLPFALAGIGLHALYFGYGSLIFGMLWMVHFFTGRSMGTGSIVSIVDLIEEPHHDN